MDKYREIFQRYWGYDDFRGIQRDIIDSIGSGHDTLGLMPTGGGKSITFQVPALAADGVCIVITPLIALMKDQVAHLQANGIKAAAIYSSMSRSKIVATLENAIFGGLKLLYVSPERLSSPLFLQKLKRIPVSFITVDEAHCISQWGYDFRPSYLGIADIRQVKPDVPVLALTATATPAVVHDIMDRLAFKDERFFKMSFVRKNVIYVVRPTVDKQKELVHILRHVSGCAIVYVRSREKSRLLSDFLTESGIPSTYYHAGLEPQDKDGRQERWTHDEVRVMVATNAFGMGIDKPDVRLVVHFDCPDAIEAYFQEAGRAGRDGQKSYAVLLWDDKMDQRMMLKRVEMNFPPKDKIADVYEHLAYFYQVGVGSGAGHTFLFNIDKFCAAYHLSPFMVPSALQLLQYAGYIDYNPEPDSVSRVRILVSRDELYRLRLPAQEDLVLTALLRLCDGIFTRYSFFDLNEVAERTQLSEQQTYLVLKTLSAKHIIHFIPNRHIPQITYLQDRVSVEEVIISPHVYEDRKQKYEQRLKAMMDYVLNDQECRSRQLLAYFGEEAKDDCGQCDVCVQHRKDYRQRVAALPRQILDLLSDGESHDLSVLRSLHFDKDTVTAAVQSLADDEKVDLGINTIRLHTS